MYGNLTSDVKNSTNIFEVSSQVSFGFWFMFLKIRADLIEQFLRFSSSIMAPFNWVFNSLKLKYLYKLLKEKVTFSDASLVAKVVNTIEIAKRQFFSYHSNSCYEKKKLDEKLQFYRFQLPLQKLG